MKQADYLQMAQGSEEMRELLRVMLAAVKAEGFTDEQAHDVVASMFREMNRDKTEEGESE